MRSLTDLTRDCVEYLEAVQGSEAPSLSSDPRYKAWHVAIYDDTAGFMFMGDFFGVYKRCREKDVATLTADEVRGCVTFLDRQMRHSGSDACLRNGELLKYLQRWLDITG